jgi:hypothetical protein
MLGNCKNYEKSLLNFFPDNILKSKNSRVLQLATPKLGFHIIQDEDNGEGVKDSSNFALITIKEGSATARQVEG